MKRYLIANLVVLMAMMMGAFSYSGSGSDGFVSGESFTPTNANEIDSALDALQAADVTLTNTFGSYLPLAGGSMAASSVITLGTGGALVVPTGASLGPSGSGSVLASAMSATGQIDDNDLAASAVDGGTAGEIEDDTITAADIAPDGVAASEIAADAVGTSEIATDGVGSAEIVADGVGASEIATDGVGAAEIAADAVGTSEIATDGVGAAEIAANGVAASEIAADSVGASELDETAAATFASVTTTGAGNFGGSTGASSFTMRNMADTGWVECGVSGTSFSCAVDADGTPDGTL